MANHLPMILVALDRLGASPQRLQSYFEGYRALHNLVPIDVPGNGCISSNNWQSYLGERAYEADMRAFFATEVRRLGPMQALQDYLPKLELGVAASALHALMRVAYATFSADEEEIGVGLAYWACSYLPLGAPTTSVPTTAEPLEILLALRARLNNRALPKPEIDLLWHFMRDVALLPEFAAVPGALEIRLDTLAKLRNASLILFASTMTFEALHAVTGCHWLRMLGPQMAAAPRLLSAFWTAIAAVYPKFGMPLPLDVDRIKALRNTPAIPEWADIAFVAVERDDEHDISLAFSAREEWHFTHDRLYQVVAAKRLGLA
jgi:hypothetical protein